MGDRDELTRRQIEEMDPAVRLRFHDMGNHITRLEGIVAGINMRVPEDAGVIPVIRLEVENLKMSHKSLEVKMDMIIERLNSLMLKVVAATSLVSGIVTYLVQKNG